MFTVLTSVGVSTAPVNDINDRLLAAPGSSRRHGRQRRGNTARTP